MDYGKLAYIGLNDVNKRLQNLEKANRSALTAYSHTKTLNQNIISSFAYELRFGANAGALSLIGKIRLKHSSPQKASVILKVNELVCYYDECGFGEGAFDYIIFASAQTQSGNNVLNIEISGPDYQGEILGIDLNLLGDSIKGYEPDACLQLVNREQKSLAVHLLGDKIVCYIMGENGFDFLEPIVLGEGINFSLCAGYDSSDKTALAYIDARGNLMFKVIGCRPVFLDDNVVSAAVAPVSGGYFVAYIKDLKAFYKLVYRGLDVSKRYELDFSLRLPESVTAVNDAPQPILLIKTSDQKIYLKSGRDSVFFEEEFKEIVQYTSFL